MNNTEKKQLLSVSNAKKYETNPFIKELEGKMYIMPRANMVISKGQSIVDIDHETGEQRIIEEGVLVGKRQFVDKSQFVKLYTAHVGVLFDLSKPAKNVFIYLCSKMNYENLAIFNFMTEYKKLGYKSRTQSLQGIRELLTKKIIAMREVYLWWVNPLIANKGERFAVYTEYIKTDDPKLLKKDITNFERNKQISMMPEIEKLEIAKNKPTITSENKQINAEDLDL